MRIKIVLIVITLILIIGLAIFGSSIKEKVLRGMISDVPEYSCGGGDLCTSCIIDGNKCNCGADICKCGNDTFEKKECEIGN